MIGTICVGPDGNLWFVAASGEIVKIEKENDK